MFKVERKITDWIIKFAPFFLLGLVTVAAVIIRIDSRKFLSSDSYGFLIPWFSQIRNNGGLGSLKEQIGDYNLLYQTIIAFMTYLPNIGDDGYKIMYCYKILSCIFDFALAAVTAFTVCSIKITTATAIFTVNKKAAVVKISKTCIRVFTKTATTM